mmetsp:Transcript_4087/g.9516  ORF Transcript_4087/g.9516 Transcript_4087/m.9516 type:complete len:232 (+) Transcript_4087:945-1640(+)
MGRSIVRNVKRSTALRKEARCAGLGWISLFFWSLAPSCLWGAALCTPSLFPFCVPQLAVAAVFTEAVTGSRRCCSCCWIRGIGDRKGTPANQQTMPRHRPAALPSIVSTASMPSSESRKWGFLVSAVGLLLLAAVASLLSDLSPPLSLLLSLFCAPNPYSSGGRRVGVPALGSLRCTGKRGRAQVLGGVLRGACCGTAPFIPTRPKVLLLAASNTILLRKFIPLTALGFLV